MTEAGERKAHDGANLIDIGIAVRTGVSLSLLDRPRRNRLQANKHDLRSAPPPEVDVPDTVQSMPPTENPNDWLGVIEAVPNTQPAPAPDPAPDPAPEPMSTEATVELVTAMPSDTPPPAGLPKQIGWFNARFWYPFLRWIDGRIRRAVDRSDLLLAMRERIAVLEASATATNGLAGQINSVLAENIGESRQLQARQAEVTVELQEIFRRLAEISHETRSGLGQQIDGLHHQISGVHAIASDSVSRIESLDMLVRDFHDIGRARSDSIHHYLGRLEASISSLSDRNDRVRAETLDRDRKLVRLQERQHVESGLAIKDVLGSLQRLEIGIASQHALEDRIISHVESLMQRNCLVLEDAFAIRSDRGYILSPLTDLALAVALIEARGCLEPGTRAVTRALIRPGDTVLDVGANVGTLTVPLAQAVGERGKVVAIEPTPEVAALLRRTVELNGLSDVVTIHQNAASDRSETIEFSRFAESTHNHRLRNDPTMDIGTVQISAVALDELVTPGDPVRLVKIDVEGDELLVWRGMRRIVAENPKIAVILEFGPSHLRQLGVAIEDWIEELQSDGFHLWEISESDGVLAPLRSRGLDEVYSLNMLLMRDKPPAHLLRSRKKRA